MPKQPQPNARSRYQTHGTLQRRWAATGRKLAFRARTPAEFVAWRRRTLKCLRELLGYNTMERAPLRPRILETTDVGDHIRRRAEIQVEPGHWMPFYILEPKTGSAPYPAMICPHGHGAGGKLEVVGCRDVPAIAARIAEANSDYGVQFARAGFMVFCPDARGFGERQEEPIFNRNNITASSCEIINHMAIPLGRTITGLWAWDLHRLIDYIQTRKDCRADAIGCAGISGGGNQTLYATALDPRIKACVISGYFYGAREALLDLSENCSCNFVPHLWEYLDMGDIAATVAPRPILIETGTLDSLNGRRGAVNAREQVRTVRKAYRLFGAQRHVLHDVFEGDHVWHGTEAIPWMQRWLMG